MRPHLLLLFLSSGLVFSSECPADCACRDQRSVFCFHRRSSAVPRVPAATRELFIFQNSISTLTRNDFRDLAQLELLDLSQNELAEIPDGVFEMLSKLKNLDLSFNHIAHISKDSFSGLVQLQRLYLHANLIQSIHSEAFEGFEMLLELKLQGNQLTSLPSLRLPRLLLLDLSYNNIPTLGPSDLQTPHLEALKAASLGLTTVNEDLIASLRNLHELDISNNQLSELPEALKQDSLKVLTKLSLATNPLSELRVEDFQKLSGLHELDLSGLNLQGFSQSFFQTFPRLMHLTAAENPFNCLCPLAWFPVWLKDKNVDLGRPEETRCHFPLVNAGKMLSALEHKEFGCPPVRTALSGIPTGSTPAPPATPLGAIHTNAIPSPPPPPSENIDGTLSPEPPVSQSSTGGEHICPASVCLHGGTCHFDPSAGPRCRCPSGTSGFYCENVDQTPEAPKPSAAEVFRSAAAMPAALDAISSRQVTATSILLDLHRFIETRPHIRGIRLTYRNLSGPDRRPIILSVPASYPEYTLRGLRPNCTYSVCANPLRERAGPRANGSAEAGSCTEARTEGPPLSSSEPRAETQSPLTYALALAGAALALVTGLAAAAGAIVCVRRRRRSGTEMELSPAGPDPVKQEGVKAGTLSHGQPETDRGHTPQNGTGVWTVRYPRRKDNAHQTTI